MKIQRFQCLREVEVELGPLTVLVGPNASGKSAFLKAMNPALAEGAIQGYRWRHDASKRVIIAVEYDDGAVFRRSVPAEPQQKPAQTYMYQLLRLDIAKLRLDNRVQKERRLATDGSNLANVFGSLTRKEQDRLASEFCALVPVYQDIDVRPRTGASGAHSVHFLDRWDESVWYLSEEVSDGTMLVLAFLLLQHQDPPVDLLVVEEPERGLHPYLLSELIGLLRSLTIGANGKRPIQIILATHSAELLDCLEPEEVRFMRRDRADGSVCIEKAPTGASNWEQAYREYQESLGSAWLSGGLGGVPGEA